MLNKNNHLKICLYIFSPLKTALLADFWLVLVVSTNEHKWSDEKQEGVTCAVDGCVLWMAMCCGWLCALWSPSEVGYCLRSETNQRDIQFSFKDIILRHIKRVY